jgi:hypothetical protein
MDDDDDDVDEAFILAQVRDRSQGLTLPELRAEYRRVKRAERELTLESLGVHLELMARFRRGLAILERLHAELPLLQAGEHAGEARRVLEEASLRRRTDIETILQTLPEGDSGPELLDWLDRLFQTPSNLDRWKAAGDELVRRHRLVTDTLLSLRPFLGDDVSPALRSCAAEIDDLSSHSRKARL